MSEIAKRRLRGISVLLALCIVSWGVYSVLEVSLRPTRFWSGWLLFLLVIALTIFNARKKLPFLPLGNATAWMEFHAYAGLFSVLVFLAHVGFEVPDGSLELLLAVFFALVSGSGIAGLLLSRLLPLRLANRGEVILFERIPVLRAGGHSSRQAYLRASGACDRLLRSRFVVRGDTGPP